MRRWSHEQVQQVDSRMSTVAGIHRGLACSTLMSRYFLNASILHGLGDRGPYRVASASRRYRRTVLREQPSCLAMDRTGSPRRAITRISTACSWVNIGGSGQAAILSQVGHVYSVGWVSFTPVPTTTRRSARASWPPPGE